jgi:membrane protein implicated in regulation of membrane protease activity
MQSQNVTKLNLSATEEASRIADKMYTLMIAMGSLQKEINDDNTKAEAAQKAVEALAYTVAALTAAQIAADVFSWVPGVAAVAAVTAVALDLAIAALVAAQVVAAAYTTAAANKTKEYAADEKEMAKDQAEYTLVENTATSFQQIADHLGNSIEGVSQAIQQFSKAINELIDSLVQQTQG